MKNHLYFVLFIGLASSGVIIFLGLAGLQLQQQQEAYGQPTDWNGEIDKCMTSLKAENPRPAHLSECDEFMPMVPHMIAGDMVYNTTEVNKQVDEYLTQRSLEPLTDEELKQNIEESGIMIKK